MQMGMDIVFHAINIVHLQMEEKIWSLLMNIYNTEEYYLIHSGSTPFSLRLTERDYREVLAFLIQMARLKLENYPTRSFTGQMDQD